MARNEIEESLTIELQEVKITPVEEGLYRVSFVTSRGDNQGLLHHNDGNTAGTVLVSGAGGGMNGPASVYEDIGRDLLKFGISSLRLDYRLNNDLDECILDTLVGIELLKDLGVERVGVAGWSFGGAVAITAGAANEEVRAVATVASQTYGTDSVSTLSPKALLLLHGKGDRTLPYALSEDLYRRAGEPKEIVLYDGANHGIDQNRDEMKAKLEQFFIKYLTEEHPEEEE